MALETFDDGRVGHAAALAHGLQPVATAGTAAAGGPAWSSAGRRWRPADAERDRAAEALVRSGRRRSRAARPGPRRERLVDLDRSMSSMDSPARSRTCSVAGIGPVSMRIGSEPTDGHRVHPGQRGQPVRRTASLGGDQQRRGAVGDLAGHRRGQPSALGERLQRRPSSPGACRGGVPRRPPRPNAGAISSPKPPAAQAAAARRWLVSANRSMSSRDDAPLLGDQLGAAELRDLLVAEPRAPAHAVVRVAHALADADDGRAGDGHQAHHLHTTGDDEVRGPGHHRLGGEVHGLLGGAALPVDGGARHRLGQAGGQPRRPGDVAGLRARSGRRSRSTRRRRRRDPLRSGRPGRAGRARPGPPGAPRSGRRCGGRPGSGRHRR